MGVMFRRAPNSTKCGPNRADVGPNRANFGQRRPKLDRCGQTLAEFDTRRPKLTPEAPREHFSNRSRPGFWPLLAEASRSWPKFGPNSAKFGSHLSDGSQNRPTKCQNSARDRNRTVRVTRRCPGRARCEERRVTEHISMAASSGRVSEPCAGARMNAVVVPCVLLNVFVDVSTILRTLGLRNACAGSRARAARVHPPNNPVTARRPPRRATDWPAWMQHTTCRNIFWATCLEYVPFLVVCLLSV